MFRLTGVVYLLHRFTGVAHPMCCLYIISTIKRLHKTQDLLYESTQSMLKLRNQWNDKSNMWLSEKDKLVMELDKCRGRLNVNRQDYPDVSPQRNVSNNNILTVDSTAKYRLESKVIFFFLHVSLYHCFTFVPHRLWS